jgi:hypothetical protein
VPLRGIKPSGSGYLCRRVPGHDWVVTAPGETDPARESGCGVGPASVPRGTTSGMSRDLIYTQASGCGRMVGHGAGCGRVGLVGWHSGSPLVKASSQLRTPAPQCPYAAMRPQTQAPATLYILLVDRLLTGLRYFPLLGLPVELRTVGPAGRPHHTTRADPFVSIASRPPVERRCCHACQRRVLWLWEP